MLLHAFIHCTSRFHFSGVSDKGSFVNLVLVLLTLTESTGNMTQCSAIPAVAPAKHVILKGVDAGRLS